MRPEEKLARNGPFQDLRGIRNSWDRIGAQDPRRVVLAATDKRRGRWDPDDSIATGKKEVDAALGTLARLCGAPRKTTTALTFGCGAGQLGHALATHYDEVIGVDVSPPMPDTARRLDRTRGRCTSLHNDASRLAVIPNGGVDLVFTSRTLQHMPPALSRRYLHEFGRIIRPGGALIALLPTGTRDTIQGALFRWTPPTFIRRRPEPPHIYTRPAHQTCHILLAAGLTVIGATNEPRYGRPWNFTRFYAMKSPDCRE